MNSELVKMCILEVMAYFQVPFKEFIWRNSGKP